MKQQISRRHIAAFFLCMVIAFLSGGCAVPEKPPPVTPLTAMVKIPSGDYPQFSDDMIYDGLEHSILQSLSYLNRVPADRTFRFGQDVFDATHMIRSLEHFLNFIQTKPLKEQLREYIISNYTVYKSVGRHIPGEVLFTGYYEPFLDGSLVESTEYRIPIYPRPNDLTTVKLSLFSPRYKGETIVGRYANQTVVPYYDRKEIEQEGFLKGTVKPIAWLRDPVDLFFLQIQGSGKVYLDNGEIMHVHYHASNGRPYRSIGRLLLDQGKIQQSEMSMQKIRAYLHDHPEDREAILNYNPSYVFFKTEKDGPLGCLDVKLTPGRSMALDRRIFPLSGLSFIETQKPVVDGAGQIHDWIDFSRFVLNHDTGGAIKGPGRADLFWGNGPYAEIAAGHMQHTGNLYFLILKPG
jgi:membrane-bound lytic murein transglycosylase A